MLIPECYNTASLFQKQKHRFYIASNEYKYMSYARADGWAGSVNRGKRSYLPCNFSFLAGTSVD